MEDLIVPVELKALLTQCSWFIAKRQDSKALFLSRNLNRALSKMRMLPVDANEWESLCRRFESELYFFE